MAAVNKIRDISLLSNLIPLGELDHEKLVELADASPVLPFAKGQAVSSGIDGAYIAYLLSGDVTCSPNSPQSERIFADSERARRPVLAPDSRCRVIAESAVTVLCIDHEILELLSNWGANKGFVVDEIDTGDSGDWLDSLMQSDAVLSLSSSGIQSIMAAIEPVEIEAGELIFNQGNAPDYYYIISSGRCVITRRATEHDVPTELAVLGPGDAFGEEALIANTRRSASARMSEGGLLLRIDQISFKRLLEQPLINIIDVERAESLTSEGAQMLDIRAADEFVSEGSVINIPFPELRARLGNLDKNKKYIVVSDDNRMSAVAAFLLGQKQFRVDVLKIADKEEIAARKFQTEIEMLEKKLEQANSRLQQEARDHEITRTKIRTLESDLNETQANARRAIIEAGTLKKKSDVESGRRAETLAQEAEAARQNMQSLAAEKEALEAKLEVLQNELQQAQKAVDSALSDTVLADVISENEQQLEMARLGQEQLLAENKALNQQLAESRDTRQQYSDEIHQLRRRYEKTLEEKESLEFQIDNERHSEEQLTRLQHAYEKVVDENSVLSDQLSEARLSAEQQVTEMENLQQATEQSNEKMNVLQQNYQHLQEIEQRLNEQLNDLQQSLENKNEVLDDLQQAHDQLLSDKKRLRDQLDDANTHSEQHGAGLDKLQKENERLQQSLGRQLADSDGSSKAYSHQLNGLKDENTQLREEKIFSDTLVEELKETLEKQDAELNGLQKQLQYYDDASGELQENNNDFCEQQADKALAFDTMKHDYEKRVAQLEQDLEQELINSSKALEKMEDDFRKEKMRSNILQGELSHFQDDSKRSGLRGWLLLVTFAFIAVLGGAYYMGIDVFGQGRMLLEPFFALTPG